MTADEALLAARREFGSIELAKERYRDQARFRSIENIGRDLRFALRQCRKKSRLHRGGSRFRSRSGSVQMPPCSRL